jgi:O-Antigen ligase
MFSFKEGEIFFAWPILIIISVIGIYFVIKRPYKAFLFATLVSLSFGRQTLFFSKIPGFGFLNLMDICFLLSIAAFIRELRFPLKKGMLKLPLLPIAILSVLIIGFAQSMVRYDQTYAIVRAFRWAIGLPIMFIIAANIVKNKERVKSLLWVLLIAGILSSLQHLLYISQAREFTVSNSADSLRTIFFIRGQESWLVAGPFISAGQIINPMVQGCIGILFLVTFFAQQTRSIAIGVILALIVYYAWFLSGKQSFRMKRFLPLILIFALSTVAVGSLGINDLAENYLYKLTDLISGESNNSETRVASFEQEIQDFSEGNMIFGEGLAYFFRIGNGADFDLDVDSEGIAYGHLGYVTYLSQLGILGFIVYAFWFPAAVLIKARKVFQVNYNVDEVRHLAALTATTFLSSIFTFIFSGSFLNPYVIIPGILGGAIWAIPIDKPDVNQKSILADSQCNISYHNSLN